MTKPPEHTALYRLYDAEHDLLYIGISRSPARRFKAHAHDKNWWHCVEYVDLAWFDSYPEAKRAENAAHLSERPPYNGMGHTGLGWNLPRLSYDDSAERAAVRQYLSAALDAGVYAPGARVWPAYVSQACGYSRSTTWAAMVDLAKEGRLQQVISTFEVRQTAKIQERPPHNSHRPPTDFRQVSE
ncbi:GIY-YIG nuclease family protein [Streptomyces californicus]|uniref:GIY-YIG nuclease family protein n=1 Tax=Streptomyces californicus TaxID=67351 RepID=UPI0037F549BB